MFLLSIIERDAVVNQLCSVIIPPIFLWAGLMSIFGEKYANYLLKKNTYKEKRIKVRMYGILRVIGICLLLLSLITYFAIYKAWDMVSVFVFVLSGYAYIKIRTYTARLEYTYRYIIFCTGKKRETLPWMDVTRITWTQSRGSAAYYLTIEFRSGLTANLSSSDFVGLTKLKTFYDKEYYKTGDGLREP